MDTTSARTAEDIVFSPLSAVEWRVSDRRYSKHEIDALLGFVARSGDGFHLTRMHHPLETTRFESLEDVAGFFAEGEIVSSEPRSELTGG